jgi:hypothetical protein
MVDLFAQFSTAEIHGILGSTPVRAVPAPNVKTGE